MSLERYKKNAPSGYCGDPGRGAAMGRSAINELAEPAGPLTVCRVDMDGGGYDVCGTYFGRSDKEENLYFVFGSDEDGDDIEIMFRARDHAGASLIVRITYLDVDTLEIVPGDAIEIPPEDPEWEDSEREDEGWAMVDALADQHDPEALPAALGDAFYDMCLRACDRGGGAHDLAEMLREVARRLDSSEEDDK
jgi:hypothetical protein